MATAITTCCDVCVCDGTAVSLLIVARSANITASSSYRLCVRALENHVLMMMIVSQDVRKCTRSFRDDDTDYECC